MGFIFRRLSCFVVLELKLQNSNSGRLMQGQLYHGHECGVGMVFAATQCPSLGDVQKLWMRTFQDFRTL